ncbi:unnamed protein product (macronuclear) [Paramecium tetraurelia]|uniref:Transmembrane protein n=1 Tax=Paramecium tetraurelia TaxID=5888 RepID=A0CLP0_PARTE|nr:uncharacterized protein GSPATT00008256001 [Paramecium tetraurelia]CAK71707.1 unnamed protein product [Paramecium tetraurelia]|eukprot:XP_001439104.1 hypothetical protein (macronuclear) [Paramecium tetraurelia strain d4-2]
MSQIKAKLVIHLLVERSFLKLFNSHNNLQMIKTLISAQSKNQLYNNARMIIQELMLELKKTLKQSLNIIYQNDVHEALKVSSSFILIRLILQFKLVQTITKLQIVKIDNIKYLMNYLNTKN